MKKGNALILKAISNYTSEEEMEKIVESFAEPDKLLPYSFISSKQVPSNFRKRYLKKLSENFTMKELIRKWAINKITIYRFYVNNEIGIFEGKNKLENEFNILLNSNKVNCKEIRKRLDRLFRSYKISDILKYYGVQYSEFEHYCSIFGFNISEFTKHINVSNLLDLPSDYSLILLSDNILNDKGTNILFDIKNTVDMKSGLVVKSEIVEKSEEETYIKENLNNDDGYYKHMSIIEFLNMSKEERIDKLETLIYRHKLHHDEIEKILGVPSYNYFKLLITRHMIFKFKNKDKFMKELNKFDSFEKCQDFVIDIIKNNRYKEFNTSKSAFDSFADVNFDVCVKQNGGLKVTDWDGFCKNIIRQSVNLYKDNSDRTTNLTEEEVLKYDKDNRKEVSRKKMFAIARETIKNIFNQKRTFVSIFDFKTAVEKENLRLKSNDMIIEVVSDLILRKSFINDNFTLKEVKLDNPVLSEGNRIGWEILNLDKKEVKKAETKQKVEPVKVEEPVVTTKVVSKEDTIKNNPPVKTRDVDENIVNTNNKLFANSVHNNTINNSKSMFNKQDFLNTSSFEITFNNNNLNDVINFIKGNMRMFGEGNICLTISKNS